MFRSGLQASEIATPRHIPVPVGNTLFVLDGIFILQTPWRTTKHEAEQWAVSRI
jgi:hypothetical protein